jgi:paraquat-inducible protein B
MGKVANKYKIGILAILSATLLVIGLASLGVMNYFHKTYSFMTAVETSVQGLEKGAKVKLRGVTIGQVKKVQIADLSNVIYIFMEFDPEAFARSSNHQNEDYESWVGETEAYFAKKLAENVERGLRCQLQYSGITATMYVEIGFFPPDENPPPRIDLPLEHPPYVPSIPSVTIGNIMEDFQKVALKIGSVDFERISKQIGDFLQHAQRLVENENIEPTLSDVRVTSDNLKQITSELKETLKHKRIEEVAEQVRETLKTADQALKKINELAETAQRDFTAAEIPKTTERAREVMDETTVAIARLVRLRDDLRTSLNQFDETMRSVRDFTDYLERHPDSLLRGKAGEPVVEP